MQKKFLWLTVEISVPFIFFRYLNRSYWEQQQHQQPQQQKSPPAVDPGRTLSPTQSSAPTSGNRTLMSPSKLEPVKVTEVCCVQQVDRQATAEFSAALVTFYNQVLCWFSDL